MSVFLYVNIPTFILLLFWKIIVFYSDVLPHFLVDTCMQKLQKHLHFYFFSSGTESGAEVSSEEKDKTITKSDDEDI